MREEFEASGSAMLLCPSVNKVISTEEAILIAVEMRFLHRTRHRTDVQTCIDCLLVNCWDDSNNFANLVMQCS